MAELTHLYPGTAAVDSAGDGDGSTAGLVVLLQQQRHERHPHLVHVVALEPAVRAIWREDMHSSAHDAPSTAPAIASSVLPLIASKSNHIAKPRCFIDATMRTTTSWLPHW